MPGSDTGLVGYGLHRELELYAGAGMTPLEVIQCAMVGSARAMNLDRDSGAIEPGKRADMMNAGRIGLCFSLNACLLKRVKVSSLAGSRAGERKSARCCTKRR